MTLLFWRRSCGADEGRLTQVTVRASSTIKLLYKWQKEVLTPAAAARGAELDPATAAELRQLRTLARLQAQELDILKKPLPSTKCLMRIFSDQELMNCYRFVEAQREQCPVRLLCQVLRVPASGYCP